MENFFVVNDLLIFPGEGKEGGWGGAFFSHDKIYTFLYVYVC